MALLQPDKQEKIVTVTAKIPMMLRHDIEAYLQYSGLRSVNKFLKKATELVLHQDKDFKRWQKNQMTK